MHLRTIGPLTQSLMVLAFGHNLSELHIGEELTAGYFLCRIKQADHIQAMQDSQTDDEEDIVDQDDDEDDDEDSELGTVDADIRDMPGRSHEQVALLRSNGLLGGIQTVRVDEMGWEATKITDWQTWRSLENL